MTEFVNSSDPKAAGANNLKAQIDAIAATIPGAGVTAVPGSAAAASPSPASSAAAGATDAAKAAPTRSGLWISPPMCSSCAPRSTASR